MASLDGKTVLITGAATGIGRAIALACSGAGARIVIGDIAEPDLEALAADLRAEGVPVHAQHCDVRSQDEIDALVDSAGAHFSEPDVVFANAGIEGRIGQLWEYEADDVESVMDINFMGVWRTLKAALPRMVARGRGSVVATASVAGLVGAEGLPIYVASKHAIVGLVRSAAISVAASGVRVNALCPGMVQTPLLDRLISHAPGLGDALMAKKPMKRLGQVDEIARAALWLASDEASFVTGHALAVDGGYTAQ